MHSVALGQSAGALTGQAICAPGTHLTLERLHTGRISACSSRISLEEKHFYS